MKSYSNLLTIVLVIIAFIGISQVLSMNFTVLGIVAVALIFLIHSVKLYPDPMEKWTSFVNRNTICPLINPNVGYYASLCILFFTALCIITLDNYFYADKTIYANNEHHALRIDGARIENPQDFVLAKNSNEAFFDNKNFHGEVIIKGYDSTGVTLKYNNFSHPIYEKAIDTKGIVYNIQNDNPDNTIIFNNSDTITFVNNVGEKIDFWITEFDVKRNKIFKHVRDTACYSIRYNNIVQQSIFSTLLTQGYSINGILGGIDINSKDFDFNGISIIRTHAVPQAKNWLRSDDEQTQYALEITENAYGIENNRIKEILVESENGIVTYDLSNEHSFSGEFKVDYDNKNRKSLFLGYGDGKTRMFSFSQDTMPNSIIIRFSEPLYRQLASIDGVVENTLYVTSSFILDTEDKKSKEMIGINVPNNISSFDIFSNSNNLNHLEPFYISFSAGKTTEEMSFILDINDTLINYKVDDGVFFIDSRNNDNLSWLVSIENLRNSTVFDIKTLLMIILFVGLISAVAINFTFIGGEKEYIYTRNTYSHVEFSAYITIIFLLTVRCFIVWRTSVFRPLENISNYELDTIFYNGGHLNVLISGLVIMYISVFAAKLFVYFRYKHKFIRENYTVGYLPKNDPLYRLILRLNTVNYLYITTAIFRPFRSIFKPLGAVFQPTYKSRLINKILTSIRKISIIIRRDRFVMAIFGIMIILYFFVILLSLIHESDTFYILCIVLLYFVIDIIINLFYAKHKNYLDDTIQTNDESSKANAISVFILTILNMGIACASLMKDNGFMIMFMSFCLVSLCIKTFDLYTKLYAIKNHQLLLPYMALSSLAIIALLFYKRIIIFALNSNWFVLLFSVLLALFAYTIYYISSIKIKKLDRGIVPIVLLWLIIFFGVGKGLDFVITGKSLSDVVGGRSTIQRINVQLYDNPSDILSKIETDADETAFLQASYNHWIIEQYNNRSENINIVGEKGNGFFKLQPQSKIGAMWGAQLTDIVILRYVITEHSGLLPILFLLLFLTMLYFGYKMPTYFRFTKSLLIQIPLLLFIQATIVWMSNTQRFIFLGQDFPLISVTSRVMILYFFVLISLWISMAILESVANRMLGKTEFNSIKELFDSHSLYMAIALLFIVTVYFLINNIKFDKQNEDTKYSMYELNKQSEPYINVIDSLFYQYQRDMKAEGKPLKLKDNMHSEISDFNNKYSSIIDTLLVATAKKISSSNIADTNDYHFIQRTWNNYVKTGSYNNSYKRIMHIRQIDTCLTISMRNDYYDANLPNRKNKSWKGNIVESYTELQAKPQKTANKGYVYYQIPINWVKKGQSYHLLKKTSTSNIDVFSLESNREIPLENNGIRQVVSLYDYEDIVKVDKKYIDSEVIPIGKRNYWARNILINGKQSFIYPAGSEMYFVRDFAEVVKKVEETNYSHNNKIEDVAITLDRELTSDLYNILKNSTEKYMSSKKSERKDTIPFQMSVIAVDGNGHIKAMVDYKNAFEINPNDYEYISNITEELYMNIHGDRLQKESNYFEDRNLSHLRGGPGSSQKPLVWTAVASAVNYDWRNLTLSKIPNNIDKSGNYYERPLFNGEMIGKNYKYDNKRYPVFKVKKSDENYGKTDIDLDKYLAHSSNFYSTLMVYLGLHSEELFKDNNFMTSGKYDDSTHAFRIIKVSPDKMKKDEYDSIFPYLKVGKKQKNVSLSKKIVRDSLYNSILYKQLVNNFKLSDEYIAGSKIRGYLYPKYDSTRASQIISNILPATSSINFNRFVVKGDPFWLDNNIARSIAIGDESAWNVTPLKMAEMYGKMMTLSSEFTCTMNPNIICDTTSNIGSDNKGFADARPKMFNSMNLFFSEGTGKLIKGRKLSTDKNGNAIIKHNGKTYFVYGKTGTTNVGNNVEHRRLCIIITDEQMNNTFKTANKFYILYFTFDYEAGSRLSYVGYDVIEKVVESDEFQRYMNN